MRPKGTKVLVTLVLIARRDGFLRYSTVVSFVCLCSDGLLLDRYSQQPARILGF